MTLHGLWPFLAVSLLVIMTPGPDTALTVRNTLIGGRRGGCLTAMGVAAGQAVWALGTSLGLVALLLASEEMFAAVRWLGAAYLYVARPRPQAGWRAALALVLEQRFDRYR